MIAHPFPAVPDQERQGLDLTALLSGDVLRFQGIRFDRQAGVRAEGQSYLCLHGVASNGLCRHTAAIQPSSRRRWKWYFPSFPP
jgi:hypothetical protein